MDSIIGEPISGDFSTAGVNNGFKFTDAANDDVFHSNVTEDHGIVLYLVNNIGWEQDRAIQFARNSNSRFLR
jgi:hypothetical protein